MARPTASAVLDPVDSDALVAAMGTWSDVHDDGAATRSRRVHLDTFDWRVRAAGGALTWADGRLVWRDRTTGRTRWIGVDAPPRWPDQLPAGEVRDLVAEACGIRCLLDRATVELATTRHRVLDDLDKTVAHVHVERGTVADGDEVAAVVVRGVRGYDDAHAAVVARLVDAGARRLDEDPADLVCRAAGLEPGAVVGGFDVDLDPAMPANAAVARACRHLLDVMRANEPGVVADLDPEFLHDYRVAVRRSRSLLAAARRVLPDDVRARFRDELRWLGDVTTPVRDLDVFALAIPDHAAAAARGDVELLRPLADLVAADQRAAHAALVDALASDRYAAFVRDWAAVLDDPPTDDTTTRAAPPVVEVARRRIRTAYRTVRRDGRAIDDTSPAASLHELRKAAKRLRYLLEAFGDLLDPGAARTVVRELKGLQANLGDFQDGEVQAQELRGFATRIARRPSNADTVMALGVLANHLEDQRLRAREEFADRFARFDAPEVRAAMEELVASRTGGRG